MVPSKGEVLHEARPGSAVHDPERCHLLAAQTWRLMARFLVVDDDGLSQKLLADTLRGLGHRVSTAGDAREALQVLSSGTYEGVITDVRMPGLDGIELCRRIALLADAPPVALTSADSYFDVHEEALGRAVRPAAFLQKPFDPSAVGRVIHALIDGEATTRPGAPQPVTGTIPAHRDEHPEWLLEARGVVSRLSPARMWFVAWRRRATGAILVRGPTTATIGLRRGQIVDIGGISGLVPGQGTGAGNDNLSAAVTSAMLAGATIETALASAAAGIARWLIGTRTGFVEWDRRWTPGADSIPLPGSAAMVLSEAIAELPLEPLLGGWQTISTARVTARTPADALPDRWGLDSPTLRAHRLATGQTVQALVYELSGGVPQRRSGAVRALELLLLLNLVTVKD